MNDLDQVSKFFPSANAVDFSFKQARFMEGSADSMIMARLELS